MKAKKFKKLALNKATIVNLNNDELSVAKAGGHRTYRDCTQGVDCTHPFNCDTEWDCETLEPCFD